MLLDPLPLALGGDLLVAVLYRMNVFLCFLPLVTVYMVPVFVSEDFWGVQKGMELYLDYFCAEKGQFRLLS